MSNYGSEMYEYILLILVNRAEPLLCLFNKSEHIKLVIYAIYYVNTVNIKLICFKRPLTVNNIELQRTAGYCSEVVLFKVHLHVHCAKYIRLY